MASVELKARAKINLSLDVTGKRPDGYHEVSMIMQTIALHDLVRIDILDKGIEIGCNSKWVPSDSRNIAYKAAELLMNHCGIKQGVRITIQKRIPVAAGLAGGSTDAAAVFKGMNSLFSLGLREEELTLLGKQVGADVPYCIKGGTMLAEGIGEVLTPLNLLAGVPIVLIKPNIGVSTAGVYKNLVLEKITKRPDNTVLIKAVSNKQVEVLARNMENVLETVTAPKYEVISDIKARLMELGALGSMMSGSGPSVFGIFKDKHSARFAFEKIKGNSWDCFLTETV